MTRGLSLYLDAARVTAAIIVLISHFAYGWASGGGLLWIRELNLGSDAVVLFFVLSGLVIAHTTSVKDATLGSYALARFSRLYSVAIPALLLSFVCALLVHQFNPDQFAWFGWDDIFEQTLRGLTFTNYVWWDSQRIAANGPYWSVGYEFWYYVLFGAYFYLRGRARLWTMVLVSLLIGPKILLLAPCWVAGVIVQRLLVSDFASSFSIARAWRFALAPWILYALLLAIDAPGQLTMLTSTMLGGLDPNSVLGFSDEFAWNFLLAALFSVHFLGVARLVKSGSVGLESAAPVIKWISARTFSLYLFHMPLLKLGSNLPGYDARTPLHSAALLVCVVSLCLALAEVTERRLPEWRNLILRLARHIGALGRLLLHRPAAT